MNDNGARRLDKKLECPYCRTIYLTLSEQDVFDTLIHCSSCRTPLGTWSELETDFNRQGGQNGVFELAEGQITRKD